MRADVSPQLDAVIRKMLAKQPEARQQSMEDVIAGLQCAESATVAPRVASYVVRAALLLAAVVLVTLTLAKVFQTDRGKTAIPVEDSVTTQKTTIADRDRLRLDAASSSAEQAGLPQSEDDQRRQRTTRRLKAVTAEQIISATAAYYGVTPSEYIGFRSTTPGRDIAAFLCRRWTGESLSALSQQFGLEHPDSSSNLVRRAKSRMEKSKQYRQAIDDIEYDLDLKTENQA